MKMENSETMGKASILYGEGQPVVNMTRGRIKIFASKPLVIFSLAIYIILVLIPTTTAEDVVGRDISTLERIPDEDTASSSIEKRDVRYRTFVNRQLIHPSRLVHATDDDIVHLTVIASNVNTTAAAIGDAEQVPRPDSEVPLYLRGFLRMMYSIFDRSTGSPIHLVMITDRASRLIVENTIVYSMGRYLSTAVIKNVRAEKPPPFPARFLVEFANLTDITATYRTEIDEMKQFYVFEKLPEPKKYDNGGVGMYSGKFQLDLFFIAPFYHLGKRSTLCNLTLSYSSEGSPARAVFRPNYL